MDIFLFTLSTILAITGLIGCFLPVLPGPPLSWLALLTVSYTEKSEISSETLIIWIIVALIVTALDYVIPVWGTKKFGGTKMGVKGSTAGLVIGLFFGPIGIIVGPFLGALIAELIHDSTDTKKALKSAIGSFVGFLLSTGLKIGTAIIMTWYFIEDVINQLG